MFMEALAKQLKEQGEKNVEVRDRKLFVNGRFVSVVSTSQTPY